MPLSVRLPLAIWSMRSSVPSKSPPARAVLPGAPVGQSPAWLGVAPETRRNLVAGDPERLCQREVQRVQFLSAGLVRCADSGNPCLVVGEQVSDRGEFARVDVHASHPHVRPVRMSLTVLWATLNSAARCRAMTPSHQNFSRICRTLATVSLVRPGGCGTASPADRGC